MIFSSGARLSEAQPFSGIVKVLTILTTAIVSLKEPMTWGGDVSLASNDEPIFIKQFQCAAVRSDKMKNSRFAPDSGFRYDGI